MTNQQALNEMLSLWNRYRDDENMAFDRGFTRFREVFLSLKGIRRWSVQDRIEETGLLAEWEERLQIIGNQPIRFEIELWFRNNDGKRRNAVVQVTDLVEQLGGIIVSECKIEEITYHALLAEIPANTAHQLLADTDVDLIKCDSIMFFHPIGQMATEKQPDEIELLEFEGEQAALPDEEPIIAILDGLPLANHHLLRDRLIIDDPDDYASFYTASERIHGTAMASMIIHGDLGESSSNPLSRPVYIRPIMKPKPWITPPKPEWIPDTVLIVDHIHRSIRRIFEGDGQSGGIAPTIRIINFSIGDPARQFTHSLSPLARLLDWLSVKYNVLFVISAGNHNDDIATGIPNDEFDALAIDEREAIVVSTLFNESRNRKIISPSESINSIAVGALNFDSSELVNNDSSTTNFFQNILPSPISAFGSGYRRAIKPDLLFNGGRISLIEKIEADKEKVFSISPRLSAPGIKAASPSPHPGDLNKTAFSCGTSNAAALITRFGSECYDTITNVFEDQAPDNDVNLFTTPLVKTLIAHSCSWGDAGERLSIILQTTENRHQIRNRISQWLGYGIPEPYRALTCSEQRATLLGIGQLADGEAHKYTLPIPTTLSARRDYRRLTITLAWLSPVVSSTQIYRAASLWFEVEGVKITPERKNADWLSVRRGTIQHEVFEGTKALPIMDDTSLIIKINCRKDAADLLEPIKYGLAVTLEVAEGIDIAIYDEIQIKIRSTIPIQPMILN